MQEEAWCLEHKRETVTSDVLVGEDFLEEVIVELSLERRLGRVESQKGSSRKREQYAHGWGLGTAQITQGIASFYVQLDHKVHGGVLWVGSGHKDLVY